ncbi:response regulator transcription factor [Marivirga salinae]|uniref:Response regulator transcription factor n=1 Tax=Marivirga salinarum TaxID=3059078 RepID=A0AA51NAI4_9BACT|nr:response regulator transcription factor [Marivirga sp. BDSF4-3]WMN11375.1 response regulator transcription factor [Marivirga sp. BDSF4-3]
MNTIKLAIVEDDILLLELISNYLKEQNTIEVMGTYGSGTNFLSTLKELEVLPEIVLLDLKMEGKNGVETADELKKNYPEINVIILSSHYKPAYTGFMLKLGVSAFIPKGVSKESLVEIITEVHEKGFYFLSEQVEFIRNQVTSNSPAPILNSESALSSRELEVLKLICQQKTAQEISELLFISKRTVEGHRNNLLLKTEAKNTAGLVIYAAQHHLISVDEFPLFS